MLVKRGVLLPGVRRTLDRREGPPMVRKTTAPRLATSCHFPKVKALTPNMLPATQAPHRHDHRQATTRDEKSHSQHAAFQWVDDVCYSIDNTSEQSRGVCATSSLTTCETQPISGISTRCLRIMLCQSLSWACGAAPTESANKNSWREGRLGLYSMGTYKQEPQ